MTFITVIYPFENTSTSSLLFALSGHYTVLVHGNRKSPNFSNRIEWVDEKKVLPVPY